MDLILLVPMTMFTLVNIIAMIAVLRVPGTVASTRALQCAFIWLVPGLGAAACLALAAYRTQGFSITSPIFQSHDGAILKATIAAVQTVGMAVAETVAANAYHRTCLRYAIIHFRRKS